MNTVAISRVEAQPHVQSAATDQETYKGESFVGRRNIYSILATEAQ